MGSSGIEHRSRMAHARATLLWAAALFLGGQVALLAALETGAPQVRDPEYGLRLQALRARMAERPAGTPVAIILGSSRVAMGIRPEAMTMCRPDARPGSDGYFFNFWPYRAPGPVMELLTLRRLLGDGVRPASVFVEAWPRFLDERVARPFPRSP